MLMFEFISKHFWAIAILVGMINVAIFKYRSKKHIEADRDLAEGYNSLIRGYMFWGNIPWIVMGVGITAGGVPTVWHYFRPQDGDPFVLAWFASVFLIWLMGTYWLFFKDGAEKLVKHPGAFRGEISNPYIIKLLWVVCLLGGIAGVVMMWTMNIPLSPFH